MIAAKTNVPDIIEWIDLNRLHVYAPTTVVLLCGGKTDPVSPTPKSFRDAFVRISHNPPFARLTFRLAEEATLYAPKPIYTNWKDFETDLAQICQLIMLFCESEGSIAELATFTDIDEIARKLLVIIDNINHAEGSYVRLGVIQALDERYGRSSIYVVHYDGLNIEHKKPIDNIDLVEFARRLSDVVPAAVDAHREPRTFDRTRAGHLIKLITGFVQHFGALTLTEIGVIMSCLDLPQTDARLEQFLECARFLEWIGVDEVGSETYYVSRKPKDAFEYSLHGGGPNLSKASWRAIVRDYWKQHEPDRFQSIIRAVTGA